MCKAYGRPVLSLSEHRRYQTSGRKNRTVGTGLRRREFAQHSKVGLCTRGGKKGCWIVAQGLRVAALGHKVGIGAGRHAQASASVPWPMGFPLHA